MSGVFEENKTGDKLSSADIVSMSSLEKYRFSYEANVQSASRRSKYGTSRIKVSSGGMSSGR